jgi:hypothetical protein
MPAILPEWIRGKLVKRREKQLPLLPPQRPRDITPSPSHISLLPPMVTANFSFFEKFPFEIRRQILIEAFGNRTVHMDLRFDHPMQPWKQKHRQKGHTHCDINFKYDKFEQRREQRLDRSKPKQWLWWSSVCHRRPPGPPGRTILQEPHDDGCLQGAST